MANKDLTNPIKETKAELSARMKRLKTIYDLPRVDIESDQAVEDRIDYYFCYCGNEGMKPTISGLALSLGVSTATLWDWETGRSRADVSPARSEIIKKAKNYIEFIMDDAAMDNKIFPATWIFYGKNYFGRKEVQEIEVKAAGQLLPTMSPEEIAKQIPKDIPVDVDYSEE